MGFVIITLLLILPFASSQAFNNHTSCGRLLRNLAHTCGQPDRAPFEECCASIREFNDNHCFCNPSSFSPAAQLSGDPYGFSARMDTCKVATPYARPVAFRDLPKGPDTCPYPPGVSPASQDTLGEVGSDNAQCQNPEELRNSREQALDILDGLHLASLSQTDVSAIREVLQTILHRDVNLTSIGLTETHGIGQVEEFLLARMVGKFEWRGRERQDVLWSAPWHVSYALDHPENRVRFMFVSFKRCSNMIEDVFVVEHGIMSALGSQFYYPDLRKDAFTEYDVSPSEFCVDVAASCADLSPYNSENECIGFIQRLKAGKQVLCNNFENDRVAMTALVGDTISCRQHYLLMTKTAPMKFCPLIGMQANEFCAPSMCPENYYGDMFGQSGQQRYASSDGFTCSVETGVCDEQWSDEGTPSSAD